MINILFFPLFKSAFSNVLEGVASNNLSLFLLEYSKPPVFYVNSTFKLKLIKCKIFQA